MFVPSANKHSSSRRRSTSRGRFGGIRQQRLVQALEGLSDEAETIRNPSTVG
jgi:hypothetical protein